MTRVNPAHPACLALRTVLSGGGRVRVAVLALGLDVCALALGCGRLAGWPACAAMGLALVACIVAAAMALRVQAGRRELASLRALGMSRCAQVLMLELEALWISAMGTVLGLLGSGVIECIAGAWRLTPGNGAFGCAGLAGLPMLAGSCGIAGVTVLAALVPAIGAARRDVALALAVLPVHPER